MKSIKSCALGTAAIVGLCLILCPTTARAERYLPDTNAYALASYLSEECWEQFGSFMYYTEDGFTSSVGVDVSKWNGEIDWYSLAAQGVDYAVIRIGYRGYEAGNVVADEMFYTYLQGAAEAGLDVGVYFFSQAINEEEAAEEAYFVLDYLGGYPLDLPVYFDTEEIKDPENRSNYAGYVDYTLNAETFCSIIENEGGYRAGIYSSRKWIRWNLDLSRLADYEIWFARYNDTPGTEFAFDMWQYTADGVLEGCDTALDMNVRVYQLGG